MAKLTLTLGTRTYTDLADFPASVMLGPARAVAKITKGTAFTAGPCRRIWVGTAGTLNFTDFNGTAHESFPVQVGENNLLVSSVETGGAATNLWAMY